jgi:hypothetical protein
MTDLIFFLLGAAVVGAGIFYAGHRTATQAFLAKAGADLSTVEQEIIAAYRKATGKASAAAPAGGASATGTSAGTPGSPTP